MLLLWTSLLAAGALSLPPPNNHTLEVIRAGCVRLYDKPNYKGKMEQLCDSGDLKLLNDRVESVRVAADVTAILKMDKSGAGMAESVTEDSPRLTKAAKNRVSSVVVQTNKRPPSGCAWLYDEIGFRGRVLKLCGEQDISGFIDNGFNDRAMSLKVPDGYQSIVFEHYDKTGFRMLYTEDQYNLLDYVGRVSRVNTEKYVGPGPYCLWAFAEENFAGERNELCQPQNDDNFQRVPPRAYGKFKSLKIAPKFQVILSGGDTGQDTRIFARETPAFEKLTGLIFNYLIGRKEVVDGAPRSNVRFLSAVYYSN